MAMDRITRAMFTEFIEQNGLDHLSESQAFEQFAGFIATSSHYSESFLTDDINVGSGGDCGIDCLAIIVNGSLITEPVEISDLVSTNGYLDTTFVFVQAETSSNFETAKLGLFGFGVRDFFSEYPRLPQNDNLKHYGLIIKEIFALSRYFNKGNPQCILYYYR